MNNVILFLLIITTIVAIMLAMTIFIAAPKNRLNRYLAIFTFFISVWSLGDILMLYSQDISIARLGAVLFYIGPMITVLFLLFFADSSPKSTLVKKIVVIPACLTTVIVAGLIAIDPSLILKTIEFHNNKLNTVIPNVAAFYTVYSLYFNAFFIITYVKLILRYRRNKGIFRSQLLLMLIGITISSLAAVVTNLLFPQFGIYDKVWLGPIFTLFFAGMTVFAIIKYRYLDIKLFVARAVAYLLLISTLVVLYALVVFGLTSTLFDQQSIFAVRVLPIIAALFLVITAPFFKRLFDRLTDRLFFRQSYSLHESINELTNYTTRSVDASQIELHTLKVIGQTIRPEYMAFLTFDSTGTLLLSKSSGVYPTQTLSLEGFVTELIKLRQKVTISDTIKDATHMKHYIEIGRIGAITRLSTSNKSIGFLVLGEKKNGSSYNGHDLQFLTLMANDLALALQNAKRYEEIQAFNMTLQARVDEATKALKRTNEKLIALDDAKDDFISMASHQLRTPLTSIKGYISMMLEEDLGKISTSQRQALKEAFGSSQRMVSLISDFLNVSRIRTGKFILEITETNLTQIVNEEIGQLRDMAELRGQKIVFHQPADFPLVRLDETKTRQVMMNMIDNAIFYTPREGTIEVTLEKTKTEIIFTVTDNGIGVPQGDQHRLFTKFFRARNARNARPDGTGLGLFMAQKIIASQDGKIIFKSVENQGSTFGFRLPLSKVVAKPAKD